MLGDSRLAGATLVGAHQSEYTKHPQTSTLDLLVATIAELCRSVGVSPPDVDGLAVSSFLLAPDNVVTVAERLGVELTWAHQGAHGGASGVVSLLHGAEAITNGRASIVVCAAADSFDTESHMAMLSSFNTGMGDFLAPYGFGGTNGIFALVEQAHREQYGTSREQLATISVAQRHNASLNENALLRAPLTVEDYLSARLIADPIRLFDCVMPCSGADAVLLMSSEAARDRGLLGVDVLAAEQRHNHLPLETLSLTTGASLFADELFRRSGITREDLDLVQLYDDYPIMVAIQLEDLGFAPKGSGGAWVADHDLRVTGDFPLNTGGGQLSCGQAGASGGMIGLYEAVTQLLGHAGERQVPDASIGLVSGFGMVGYGRGLSSAAAVLARGEQP